MMLGIHATKKVILRIAATLTVAMSAGGCSSLPDMPSMPSVPDWVDPTTWFGDDSANATTDNGQTPDLAGLPDKPGTSTPDEQRQVTESLASDRTNAKYSADALRGGTEPTAAPPPNVADSSVAPTQEKMPVATQGAAPAPARIAQADRSVASEPTGSSMAGTLPSTGAAPVSYAASEPAPTPAQVAAVPPTDEQPAVAPRPRAQSMQATSAPPPGAQPAVPPLPAVPQRVASIAPSDAALGFKPSAAPPLDPSVSQFVSPSIIQRYRQTASTAGIYSSGVPLRSESPVRTAGRLHRGAATQRGEGGPETMTGAVVANLDAIQATASSTPNVYASAAGLPPTAVIFFPGDTELLNGEARAKVRAAAEQFKARGGQAYIRVVGHSSSRTPNMPLDRHLEIIFQKSQARANAVAQELIREGVPADKVLVEAVGDSQPIYYESMPKGEDGNRRAEIFIQG